MFCFIFYRDQPLINVLHYQSLVIIFMPLSQVEMKMLVKEFIQVATLMIC